MPGKLTKIKSRIAGQVKSDTPVRGIFRNMALLATGSMAARVIGFATIPVITRLYTPDHFGVLSVFVSMTALILPFGTLRYSTAIPLPKHDGTAANIIALCLVSLAIVTLLISLLLGVVAPLLLHPFSIDDLLSYWWLVTVGLVGGGGYEILSAWAIREKAFAPLAKVTIWQSFFSALVKIGLGLVGFKPIGLLIGHVGSHVVSCIALSSCFYSKLRIAFKHVSVQRLAFVFKRYADFPKFRLPSQFLLAFSTNAPLLFSAILFGKETTGQLGLTMMVLALPIALFGNTTGQAYYAEIAKIGRKSPSQILQISKSVTTKLFFVSLLPFCVLFLMGPWLFTVVFGAAWHDAGMFARILSGYLLAQFVVNPIINVLNVFDEQMLFLRINIVRLSVVCLAFGLSYILNFSSYHTFMFYGLLLSFHYVFTYYLILNLIKTSESA